MNKRGSHVDVIISFVVFVALIIFLYAILQPTITTQQNQANLQSSIQTKLLNSMSDTLTSINLKVYETETGLNCVRLMNLLNSTGLNPAKLAVLNSTGPLKSNDVFTSIPNQGQNMANDLFIETSFSGTSGGSRGTYFFKIYNASEFSQLDSGNQGQGTCPEVYPAGSENSGPDYYTLGQVRSQRIIFESIIEEMAASYSTNYGALRQSLGIPTNENFGFEFIDPTSGIDRKAIGSIPSNANVYSEMVPIEYVSIGQEIKEGKLIILTW